MTRKGYPYTWKRCNGFDLLFGEVSAWKGSSRWASEEYERKITLERRMPACLWQFVVVCVCQCQWVPFVFMYALMHGLLQCIVSLSVGWRNGTLLRSSTIIAGFTNPTLTTSSTCSGFLAFLHCFYSKEIRDLRIRESLEFTTVSHSSTPYNTTSHNTTFFIPIHYSHNHH